MMLLVECCETLPWDILGATDSWLIWIKNILFLTPPTLITITSTIECFNFDVHIVLAIMNTKKRLSKLKLYQSMFMTEELIQLQLWSSHLCIHNCQNYMNIKIEAFNCACDGNQGEGEKNNRFFIQINQESVAPNISHGRVSQHSTSNIIRWWDF